MKIKKFSSYLKESHNDDTSYMIPQHLKSMKEKIEKILEIIGDEPKLDSWVESHIIEASTKLDDVFEFINNDSKPKKEYKVRDNTLYA